MARVNIEINGRKYALGCEDGEEERLTELASQLDERISALADQFGQIGDQRLLVMAGISLLDELDEMREDMESHAETIAKDIRRKSEAEITQAREEEQGAVDALEAAARKIEKLADRLSRA